MKKYLILILIFYATFTTAYAVNWVDSGSDSYNLGKISVGTSTIIDPLTIDSTSNYISLYNSGSLKWAIGTNAQGLPMFYGGAITSAGANMFMDFSYDDSIFGNMQQRFARASSSASAGAGNWVLRRSRGTVSSLSAIQDGDRIVNFNSQGYDGSAYLGSSAITTFADGTISTGSVPIRTTIETSLTGSSTRTNILSVRGDGRFQITGSNTLETDTAKSFFQTEPSSSRVTLKIKGSASQTGDFFQIADSSNNNLLTVDTAGRLGLNDSTPSYDLDVNGDINFTGVLYQNGVAVQTSASVISPTLEWFLIFFGCFNIFITTIKFIRRYVFDLK